MDNEEAIYGSCDNCKEGFPIEELEECPSSWYEVKHGISINKNFCHDCCESIFEYEGCQSDVGNCDRATEIMAEHIKKYAEDKGFSLFKGKLPVYLDNSKIFCIADNGVSVEEVFKDKLIFLPYEDFELWEGKDTYLVKPFCKKMAYSKGVVEDILEIFDDLGCYQDVFGFLKDSKIFVVTSDGMWSALAPRFNEPDYDMERNAFIRDAEQGYRFFEIGKKDGLVLVDTKRMEFDWSKLTEKDFVGLCADILKSLPKVTKVDITEGTSDLGQDIRAIESNQSSLIGEIKYKSTIQCKHYLSRKIATSDIADIFNSYSQLEFDVFWLMASNLLLPSCRRMLEAWNSPKFPFRVRIWDVKRIEDYVRNKPEIYARYFSR